MPIIISGGGESGGAGGSGGNELQSSETARQKYTNTIKQYRDLLTQARNKAATLAQYGQVGTLESANTIKFQLGYDVTGPKGVLAIMDEYISDLNDYERKVNAAFTKMHAEDMKT